jgi:light-regulated signal transduction histidine kinase (bacteriophytochrome)
MCSHDLQEPLRMVTSYLGLLERHNRMEGKSREYMDYALEGASRMKELIDDLLAYSRVDTQRRRFEEVDMNQVLKRVLQNQGEFLEANHATVTADDLPIITADETQMVQILQNLVNNAVKFHGTKPPDVRISCEEQSVFWVLKVQDNGIGIPPQYRERVFEMFQRLHTRSEYDGTGIRLATSRRIAERHGGRIWVESDGSNGSTFCFTIAKGVKA